MNDYIKKAFSRMNLWQIRAFVLHGVEHRNPSEGTYEERLESATAPIYDRMHKLYTSHDELTEATDDIANATSACEEIYMEIGMKLGAKLIFQLLVEE